MQLMGAYNLIIDMRVYGPYKRKSDGRSVVRVVEDDGTTRTISYPKWLLELQLGRRLDPDKETVDHWDSNIENNDLSNLRIVPREEHSANDTRRVKPVKFKCAWCKKKFERSPRLVRDKARKNKAGPFCSRKCAGQYSRKLQLKLIDKFDTQPVIDSEYYKKKYVKAFTSIIDSDMLIDYLCIVLAEPEYLYHETQKEHLPDIKREGLRCTSYGQSLVGNEARVMSPEEYKDSIRQDMEMNPDLEEMDETEFEKRLDEQFRDAIPAEDLEPRTYVMTTEPRHPIYGDILVRFPSSIAGPIDHDVDDYITQDIPPEYLEIFTNGQWKKLA